MSFLDKFFGPSYAKDLKQITPVIEKINQLEASYAELTDIELVAKTQEYKTRFNEGETLEELLPEAFASVREAAKRTLNMRHYDVQLIGGILLHNGRITEMRTGEGKTLVGTLPGYLNTLTGKGVHVVTVNDYLSRRDAVWMGQIYDALGLKVGIINSNASYLYTESTPANDEERDEHGGFKVEYDFLQTCTRQESYLADIVYGTNSEFGFDYLRDNIEFDAANLRQRDHAFAIVDEIDSILIDEARTPLIISAPAADSENFYEQFAGIARQLKLDEDYQLDEKLKSATLTDAGVERVEKILGIENIYTDRGIKHVHHLETAVRAEGLYTKDKEYVVRDNEIVIVDEFTGRLQPGRRWSEGLHQAVEAKEGVAVQRESRTYASITYQNFFRMYDKLAGMTGTALTSSEEFFTVYGLDVVPVPTNKEIKRIDKNDHIYQSEKGKIQAIVAKVKEVNELGQPILIGTASIEKNEQLSSFLTAAKVPYQLLNAKNHESEGEIIAAAGRKGAVTVATNMAGRGVDIKLGGPEASEEAAAEVKALGGLFVLGTERHEARRIDNQLRGRAGRQGDPGMTQFYVSMEDSLMRVFGGDRIKSLMNTFKIPEDQPIENKMISRQLEGAQTKIEGFHFDSRKQVLAYDDVLNKQRQVIYARRKKLLLGEGSEVKAVLEELFEMFPDSKAVYETREKELGTEVWKDMVQKLMLQVTDTIWVEHLEIMQYTRASVNLRAYGQRDPLNEYRKEGNRLFKEMQFIIFERIAHVLPSIQPQAIAKDEAAMKQESQRAQQASTTTSNASTAKQPKRASITPGRNDLVTIQKDGEEKTVKYKKAEPLLEEGWSLKQK